MTETDGMSARFMTTIVRLIIVRIVSLFWHFLWKKKKKKKFLVWSRKMDFKVYFINFVELKERIQISNPIMP